MLTVKVREIEKAGEVIDAVVAAGGDLTRVNNVSFDIEDKTPYYEQARTIAMNYAKAKAQQLADDAGVTLGKISYITESSYTRAPSTGTWPWMKPQVLCAERQHCYQRR
jgi:uncharacterized protein YggE